MQYNNGIEILFPPTICANCSTEFYRDGLENSHYKYCSDDCQREAVKKQKRKASEKYNEKTKHCIQTRINRELYDQIMNNVESCNGKDFNSKLEFLFERYLKSLPGEDYP